MSGRDRLSLLSVVGGDRNLDRIREDARFKAFLADMERQSASLRTALFDGKDGKGRR